MQVGQSHPARDGMDRHGRMLKGEFDVAEFSMSTYLMAIDRKLPITGVPVFPRRLFSRRPVLRARRFAVAARPPTSRASASPSARSRPRCRCSPRAISSSNTACRGRTSTGCLEDEEKIAFEPQSGLKIDRLPRGTDVGHLLRDGKVDAVIQPHPPQIDDLGRGADAPAVRRSGRRGAALLQEIRLPDHAHPRDQARSGRARTVAAAAR